MPYDGDVDPMLVHKFELLIPVPILAIRGRCVSGCDFAWVHSEVPGHQQADHRLARHPGSKDGPPIDQKG